MSVVALFLYIVSTVGMCHIIVDGSILQNFRDLVKWLTFRIGYPKLGGVVDCYLCAGTWTGFLMGYIWLTHEPLQIFACGCAGGFLSNFAAVVLNYLEAATIVSLPDDKPQQETHE